MNYIHFSPAFPPNYYQFSMALKKAGATALGIGDTPWHELKPELRDNLDKYYKVDNLHNDDQLIAAVQQFADKYGTIHGIDSHNEYWLEREAMLREKFNIPGLKPADLVAAIRKSAMKEMFKKAGLRVAPGILAQNYEQAAGFMQSHSYPVVAKPDRGVGATNTFKINNDDELKAFFERKPAVDFFIETYVNGDVVTFDGLTGKDGELLFYTSTENGRGVMEVVNEDTHIYFFTYREISPELEAAGRKVLKAYDVRNRFFHFEFFRERESGEIIALEVNMRPPGVYIIDMFNYSADINLYQLWADMLVNGKIDFSFERKYHICFVGRKHHYKYALSHDVILKRFADNLAFHSPIDDVFSRAMGNYCYLVRTENFDRMFEVQQAIHQLA
jgi:biotin carboxylase